VETNKDPNDKIKIQDKVDDIISCIVEFFRNQGTLDDAIIIKEHMAIIIEYLRRLGAGTSDASAFMSVDQIERLLLELRSAQADAGLRALLVRMRNVKAESGIIAQKKSEYRQKGVRLRIFCRSGSSVMTLAGRVPYERMALVPSRPADKARLREIGTDGYVYPLDEALGLSDLPYKITVGAMLEIAKESARCDSYEEAERTLRDRTGLKVNDDTLREVTNTVGAIVFCNDAIVAESARKATDTGSLGLGATGRQGALYLEVDAALLPTRQDGQKGVVYKDNRLGMAFSSDNIYWWKHKQLNKVLYSILKKEYTCLIGNSNDFNKFIFSLAIRNGYGSYQTTVLISDGATWIRKMKDSLFPDAQLILNFYHLKKHIINYYMIIYNFNKYIYLEKYNHINNLFYDSKSDEAIEFLKKNCSKKYIADLDILLEYIDHNINNIDYAAYRRSGFCVGSGAIESSTMTVLQRRLRHGAMRWNASSAQAVATLLAKARSGLWESDVVKPLFSYYGQQCPGPGDN
jgi:hypothetical protein